MAGGTVYVGGGETLYALDAATGQVRWTYNTTGADLEGPVVAGGTVYVSGGAFDDKVYAVDAASGHVGWTYTFPEGATSPAVAGGTIYVTNNNTTYAVTAAASG